MDGSDSESRMARAMHSGQAELESAPRQSPPLAASPPPSPPLDGPTSPVAGSSSSFPPPPPPPPSPPPPPPPQEQSQSQTLATSQNPFTFSPGSSYPAQNSPFSRHTGSTLGSSSPAQGVSLQSPRRNKELDLEDISADEIEEPQPATGLFSMISILLININMNFLGSRFT